MRHPGQDGPERAAAPRSEESATPGGQRTVLLVSSVTVLEGGGEQSLLELARQLPATGWTPVLAAWSEGPLPEAFRAEGLRVHVRKRRGRDPASPLGGRTTPFPVLQALIRPLNALRLALRPIRSEAAWLARVARESEARVLHTNCDLSLPAAARVAAETGLPRLAHVRDRVRSWLHPRILGALRSADAVVAPVEGVTRWLRERGVDARPIPSPPPLGPLFRTLEDGERERWRQELGVEEDTFAVAVLGRLEEPKGTWDVVRAAERLLAAGEPLTVLLAGRGEPAFEAALDERIAAAGLGHRILRLGWRDDVMRWLPALDAVVSPGRLEALPRAILEGMAAGLPVVATDDGGGAEVLVHGETGLLVPPADPDAIAAQLRRLVRDPELGRTLGRRAREWVRTTRDHHAATRTMADLYDALEGSEPSPQGDEP